MVFLRLLTFLALSFPFVATASRCVDSTANRSTLSAEDMLNVLSPTSLSVWMLRDATVVREIKSDKQGVALPESTATARMLINQNLAELKGSFGHPLGRLLEGHFPGNPVVPGVIQAKMMAQLATFVVEEARISAGKTIKPVRIVRMKGFRFSEPLYPGANIGISVKLDRIDSGDFVFKGQIDLVTADGSTVKSSAGEFVVSTERSNNNLQKPDVVFDARLNTSQPALTRTEVKKFLPHRKPLLLIDRVLQLPSSREVKVGDKVIAELTTNEAMLVMDKTDFRQGVVPEDIQVEVMAQSAAFVLHNQYRSLKNEGVAQPQVKVLLTGIKSAEFYDTLMAGERLIVTSEVKSIKRGMIAFESTIQLADGHVVSRARLGAFGAVESP